MTLRVGIVGAGWIGQYHAARWRQLPVRLAGFYDVRADVAQQAVDAHGGQRFASVEQLLRAVDVVQVCTPTIHHKDYVLQAAACGRHIFCEKPLARRLADARAMITACERAGVRLFVGQVLRFFPQYVRAKELVDAGVVGRPGKIRLLRAAGHPAVSEARAWFKSVEDTGGCMLEGGVHDLDFARWALGDAERVMARGLTYRGDLPVVGDHSLATLRFRSGAIGHVEESWMVTDGRFRQQFEIAGDRGCLSYDSLPPEPLTISLRSESRPALLPAEPLYPRDDPYYHQLAHFVACLENDREFLVSPQDGLEAMRLSLAVLESMRTGRAVSVQDVN
jgi:predicted dehydrogenase